MATLTAKYQPYPDYKPSGVDWLGTIPGHWEAKRLKFVARIEAGQSPPSERVSQGMEAIPFLQGNAEFGAIYPSPRFTCEEPPKNSCTGDILLSVRAPVGAINIGDQPYGIGRGLCAIRPSVYLEARFTYYLLLVIRTCLSEVATGSTYDAVTTGDVGNVPAILPTRPEQHAIVAFLDQETARIDALVAKKVRLIELLQEKRTALITRAVIKGLDPKASMKDSGVEWLGEIPAHWEVKRLKHLAGKVGSGKTPRGGAERYADDGVMLLRSQNVHFGGLRLTDVAHIDTDTDDEMSGSRVLEGDVLLNITGASLGRSCVAKLSGKDANVNQHVCIIRTNQQEDVPDFLAYSVESRSLQDQIFNNENGVSRDALNFEQIGDLLFARPAKNEQTTIAAFLDGETAKLDSLITKIQEAIERLQELRTALISAAVTGRIDVRGEAGCK